MPVQIINQNITAMHTDVIVNPTDSAFSGSGGVDYQIHKTAGAEMDKKCAGLPGIDVGDVCATQGFNLLCKYVIHTVGPVWKGGKNNESVLLKSCYVNSLMLALKLGAESVAFPLISSGTFGFPKDKVLRLALKAISDFLFVNDCDLDVFICIVDRNVYEFENSPELETYLDTAVKNEWNIIESCASLPVLACDVCYRSVPIQENNLSDLDEWLEKHDDTFAVTLLKLIDKKGLTDVECYKKANISRKTFSKINTDKDYRPSKQTVIAFAVALELDVNETEQLLKTVGFSLSHSNTFDLIIEFCINKKYTMF